MVQVVVQVRGEKSRTLAPQQLHPGTSRAGRGTFFENVKPFDLKLFGLNPFQSETFWFSVLKLFSF
jgi:hypothetical protein